jgi:YggT family protein
MRMLTILSIIALLLDVAFFILLVHVIMSWLLNFGVLNRHQPLVASIWDGLNRLLEPIYRPIRRVLPDTGALDLAPLVAFLLIIIFRDILIPDLARSLM